MAREYRDDELQSSVVIPGGVREAVKKSCLDPSFKTRLLEKPAETLRTGGVEIQPGMQVEVLQDTDEVLHLVLPFNMSQDSELSDAQLAGVVGGSRKTSTSKSMYS